MAGPGQVVVEVERVGICGTDVELFTGEMAYLHQGHASYPLRPGHEWVGRVSSVGEGVSREWLGGRVTSDTMIGCGSCDRCRRGRHQVCEERFEIGVRGGWPGALAEQLLVPADVLHRLPETISPAAAALVEPGACAYRAVTAAAVDRGERLLIFGPGTIGLLAALFALARGVDVHVVGIEAGGIGLARDLGVDSAITVADLEESRAGSFHAVIDATSDPDTPAASLHWVEPGGHLVLIGLAGRPSLIDTRHLVLSDLTTVGVLGGSAAIDDTIGAYASGEVVPDGLVSTVGGLDDAVDWLAGDRPHDARPKLQVDPHLG
jgi:2-desacetyl-2-hydroxyethyl bacteriochlorophyllide A dehydrogenase